MTARTGPFMAAAAAEPPAPEGWSYIRIQDVVPAEALDVVLPVMNDLEAGRITQDGAKAAIVWILRRHEPEIRGTGWRHSLETLAHFLILVGMTGGDPELYRRTLEEIMAQAGVEVPPIPPDPELERIRDSARGALAETVPMWMAKARTLPQARIEEFAKESGKLALETGETLIVDGFRRSEKAAVSALQTVGRALGLLAFMPGGVDFMGLHFEGKRE